MNEILTKKVKHAIRSFITCAPDNVLIELDLSAAESHVVARLSNDETMIDLLTNGDLHIYSARNIYNNPELTKKENPVERYIGKKSNHLLGYGGSANILAESINKEGMITVSVAQTKIWRSRWHASFSKIQYWWSDIGERLKRDNGYLTTAYGKKRKFWAFKSHEVSKDTIAYEPQSVVSYHLDGCIHPDVGIAGGLIEIQKQITNKNPEIKLINTSHDSVLIECPRIISTEIAIQAKKLLTRPLVVNGHYFTIPVDCERYDRRWKEDSESLIGDKFVSGH